MIEADEKIRDDAALADAAGAALSDVAAERALLGYMLAFPARAETMITRVAGNDFSDILHRRIYEALRAAVVDGYALGFAGAVDALGGDASAPLIGGATVGEYIADMIAAVKQGFDPDDALDVIIALSERRAVIEESERSEAADTFESKFRAVTWADLDTPGDEHDWLIKGILTRGERSLCVGPSGSGKSFLVADMALAVARGIQYAGRRTRRGLVLYQAGEGGKGLKKRLRAYRIHHKIEPTETVPFVLFPCPIDLYGSDADTDAFISEARRWADFYKRTAGVGLELIVIDTLSAATPGANENASEDVSKILMRCARIADALACSVMLVHHLNAAGSRPRGHSSMFANIESAIEVGLTERTAPGGTRADGSEIRRKIRSAKITKQKDGEDGLSWDFVLKQVIIGKDFDGDPVTSCVVEAPEQGRDVEISGGAKEQAARQAGGLRLSNNESLFFKCLLDALADNGEPPPPEFGLPQSIARVVKYDYVKSAVYKKSLRDDDDGDAGKQKHRERTKKLLERARGTLGRYGIISWENSFMWWTGKPVNGFRETVPRGKPAEPKQEEFLGPPGDVMEGLF